MEYYSAFKMNKILPFATMWIDLEGIMLTEISQTENKDKYHMILHICRSKKLDKKIKTKLIYNREEIGKYQRGRGWVGEKGEQGVSCMMVVNN